jgi:hypothetical protein
VVPAATGSTTSSFSSPTSINNLASALEALLAESAAASPELASADLFGSDEVEARPEQNNLDFRFDSEFDSGAGEEPKAPSETSSEATFDSLFNEFDAVEFDAVEFDAVEFDTAEFNSTEAQTNQTDLLLEPEISSISPDSFQLPDELLIPDTAPEIWEPAETPTASPQRAESQSTGSASDDLAIAIDLTLLDQFATPAEADLTSTSGQPTPGEFDELPTLDDFRLETTAPELGAESGLDSGLPESAASQTALTAENWFEALEPNPQPAPEAQPDEAQLDNTLDSLLSAFAANQQEQPPLDLEPEPPAEPSLPATNQPLEQFTAADLFQFDLPADSAEFVAAEPVSPELVDAEDTDAELALGQVTETPTALTGEEFNSLSESPASELFDDLFIPEQFSAQFSSQFADQSSNQFDDLANLEIDMGDLEFTPNASENPNDGDSSDATSDSFFDSTLGSIADSASDSTADLALDLGSDLSDFRSGFGIEPTASNWLAIDQLGSELPAANISSEVAASEVETPEIAAPEIAAPEIAAPEIAASDLPRVELADQTADLTSLSLDQLGSALPDVAKPAEFLSDLELPESPSNQATEVTPVTPTASDFEQMFADLVPLASVEAESPAQTSVDLEPELPEAGIELTPSIEPEVMTAADTMPSSFEPREEVDAVASSSAEPVQDSSAAALPDSAPVQPIAALFEPPTEPVTEPPVTEPSEPATTPSDEVAALIQVPVAPMQPETPPEAAQTEAIAEAAAEAVVSEAETGLDDSTLAQLDQLLAPPPVETDDGSRAAQWYLSIDIGTTGLSAVLLNQTECQLYPIYWQVVQPTGEATGEPTAKKQFRLSTSLTLAAPEAAEPTALPLPTLRPTAVPGTEFQLSDWKPFLKVALPHHSPQTSQWEPVLQWTTQQTLPLRTLQEVLQELLLTLNPARNSVLPVTCGALGLETEQFTAILQNLNGVVLGYPSNWLDTYSFNLREAVLQAGLVSQPGQVVFVEEAVAALLSALPAADGRPLLLSPGQGQSGHVQNANWQGITLILTAGASVTELVLVNLPPQLQQLNATDFYVRSLPYAGQGLDQDIITQVLYPALIRAAQVTELEAGITADLPTATSQPESSPDFSLPLIESDSLDSLVGLSTLPAAAELAPVKRYQLQQRLLSNALGQQLLAAAHALKITLQYQSQFRLEYGDSLLVLERQDLTSQVFLPYVQRLNRELNTLLAQTNTTATAIQQVICTGGTASASVMTRWLRQKLPNATIIQDTYARPASPSDRQISSCSRVAYGLATLPLHSQVVDWSRHRYSDYFLLAELLRTLPQQPLRVEAIMDLLKQRGLDTQTCRFRILALLDGHLPAGLVPSETDAALLTRESAANPDYQAIRLAPLLHKPADRTYEPNRPQWAYLQYYLATLLADTEQTLSEPLQGLALPNRIE